LFRSRLKKRNDLCCLPEWRGGEFFSKFLSIRRTSVRRV
jgi:hypothetical protein